ncbi:MAG: HAD family hydrolase [Treponema sp.]|nr:HAD family hydrolase [Treponema sp.]
MAKKNFDTGAIRAAVFDLDGTLLRPDKTLSGKTLRVLHSCMEKGMRLIIATGRSLVSGERYREQMGIRGPQIYFNGAKVADMSAGRIIHTQFIDPPPILFCVHLARQMGLYYQVYFSTGTAGEILMADRITEEAHFYRKSTSIEVFAGDLEEQLVRTPAVIKGMFITLEENTKKIRPILQEQFGDSVCVVQSSPVFLETLAAGVSKGSGLAHVLEYVNLKPEETIAFGDEENDLSLFKTAGFSAAPANAAETVLNAAMFQIPSNSEDGVAVFLEKWFAR